jgi:signal transduction histidine kinase
MRWPCRGWPVERKQDPGVTAPPNRWQRWRRQLGHSIKLRLVLLFLLLAAGMSAVFLVGAQKAFSLGWREAARPLLADYVDRLAAEVAGPGGEPPSTERALAITRRLPLTIEITGPVVQWASHPQQAHSDDDERGDRRGQGDWSQLIARSSADGHQIRFGIDTDVVERRPRLFGVAMATLLLITLLAWLYVRHLLKPLDAISAGARRFGAGDFDEPIPLRRPSAPDELGQLAATINTMGQDIRRMLDAKRALLLAISHELRSPLTRARLNVELLPETTELHPQRQALLHDLQEMAALITDLLESERLSGQHAVLHREPTDVVTLARMVLAELGVRHAAAAAVELHAPVDLPAQQVDPARLRLLLRNLLDNALRHGAGAARPPELHLADSAAGLQITVRDHGTGVPDEQIERLAEAFYRPDAARTRSAGGVGLGLYLCRLVAQAHGGRFEIANAQPGLRVAVTLPGR